MTYTRVPRKSCCPLKVPSFSSAILLRTNVCHGQLASEVERAFGIELGFDSAVRRVLTINQRANQDIYRRGRSGPSCSCNVAR
jgi:hypothetical protein